MKKYSILTLLLLLYVQSALAQFNKEDLTIAESLLTKAKKMFVSDYMGFKDTPENETFWKLYDAYEAERTFISQEHAMLISRYALQYESLNDEFAIQLFKDHMINVRKMDKLNQEYFKKFTKEIGGLKAATIFQIENYIQTAMLADTYQQIPIIGQLEKMRTIQLQLPVNENKVP